jgi:ABC-type ATPase involved in cell division
MNRPAPVVEFEDVWKSYRKGADQRGGRHPPRSRRTRHGGASGSGKSTLLHRPTRGAVRVAGQNVGDIPEGALTRFRREVVGFVFQTST